VPRDSIEYAFTKADYFRSPDARPDVAAIQRDISDAVELGLLKDKFELAPRMSTCR